MNKFKDIEQDIERIVQDRVTKIQNNEMSINDLFNSVGSEVTRLAWRNDKPEWNQFAQITLTVVRDIIKRIKERIQDLENKESFLLEQNEMSAQANRQKLRSGPQNYQWSQTGPINIQDNDFDTLRYMNQFNVPNEEPDLDVADRASMQRRHAEFKPTTKRYHQPIYGSKLEDAIDAKKYPDKFKDLNAITPNTVTDYSLTAPEGYSFNLNRLGEDKTVRVMKRIPGTQYVEPVDVNIKSSNQMNKLIDIVAGNQLYPKFYPNTVTLDGAQRYANKRPGWKAHQRDITGIGGQPDGIDEIYVTDSNGNIRIINGVGLRNSDYTLRNTYLTDYPTRDEQSMMPFTEFKKRMRAIDPMPDEHGNFKYLMADRKGIKRFRDQNISPRKYFVQYIFKPIYDFYNSASSFVQENPFIPQLKSQSYQTTLTQVFYGFFIPNFFDKSYNYNTMKNSQRSKWMERNQSNIMRALPEIIKDKAEMKQIMMYTLNILSSFWDAQRRLGKITNNDKPFDVNQISSVEQQDQIFEVVYGFIGDLLQKEDTYEKLNILVPSMSTKMSNLAKKYEAIGNIELDDGPIEVPEYLTRKPKAYQDARKRINARKLMFEKYQQPLFDVSQMQDEDKKKLIQARNKIITDENQARLQRIQQYKEFKNQSKDKRKQAQTTWVRVVDDEGHEDVVPVVQQPQEQNLGTNDSEPEAMEEVVHDKYRQAGDLEAALADEDL